MRGAVGRTAAPGLTGGVLSSSPGTAAGPTEGRAVRRGLRPRPASGCSGRRRTSAGPSGGRRRVARAGFEPATFHFSGERCYQLSYLAEARQLAGRLLAPPADEHRSGGTPDRGITALATPTGLEPATSAVTGRRANQLRYGALLAQLAAPSPGARETIAHRTGWLEIEPRTPTAPPSGDARTVGRTGGGTSVTLLLSVTMRQRRTTLVRRPIRRTSCPTSASTCTGRSRPG